MSSHIRVTVEYIPPKGKIRKWGAAIAIPAETGERVTLATQLSESMATTIAAVLKGAE